LGNLNQIYTVFLHAQGDRIMPKFRVDSIWKTRKLAHKRMEEIQRLTKIMLAEECGNYANFSPVQVFFQEESPADFQYVIQSGTYGRNRFILKGEILSHRLRSKSKLSTKKPIYTISSEVKDMLDNGNTGCNFDGFFAKKRDAQKKLTSLTRQKIRYLNECLYVRFAPYTFTIPIKTHIEPLRTVSWTSIEESTVEQALLGYALGYNLIFIEKHFLNPPELKEMWEKFEVAHNIRRCFVEGPIGQRGGIGEAGVPGPAQEEPEGDTLTVEGVEGIEWGGNITFTTTTATTTGTMTGDTYRPVAAPTTWWEGER
jgi:hypothetical protein